ncbi:MAG: DUF4129 domain-containing protein [Haloarcula sp.]
MSTNLVRAALALLCAVAVLFGTALFPGALGVEFGSDGPLDSQRSEQVTPDGVDDEPTPAVTSDGEGADTTPTPEPTSTATPAPTETETETEAAGEGSDDDSGSPLLVKLLGMLLIGGFGVVAVGVIRAATNRDEDMSTADGAMLPLVSQLVGVVVSMVSDGTVGRTVGRIPQLTTAALLSGSSALARVGTGISTVSSGVLTGLATGIGSVGAMSLRGLAQLPSAFGSLSVAPFQALSGLGGTGGFFSSVRSGIETPSLFDSSDSEREQPTHTDSAEETDDGPTIDALSIQEAWTMMTERVSVSDPETATPGEYARQAIDSGLPAEPVRRLTVLFREIKYGGKSPSADRTESARDALKQLLGGGED